MIHEQDAGVDEFPMRILSIRLVGRARDWHRHCSNPEHRIEIEWACAECADGGRRAGGKVEVRGVKDREHQHHWLRFILGPAILHSHGLKHLLCEGSEFAVTMRIPKSAKV